MALRLSQSRGLGLYPVGGAMVDDAGHRPHRRAWGAVRWHFDPRGLSAGRGEELAGLSFGAT